MAQNDLPPPAFGQADLTNCEREPIHLAGSIQPHGALIVLAGGASKLGEALVIQASANATAFLDQTKPVHGRALAMLGGNLASRVEALATSTLDTLPVAFRCTVGGKGTRYDALMHTPSNGGLVIELERTHSTTTDTVDRADVIARAMKALLSASSLKTLADETARFFRELTGYDRVMVYRFDDDGHGEVFAERRRAKLEPFLGNRYPASDIPQIARRLYEKNRVRIVADVEFKAIGLDPAKNPASGRELDMSLCFLRATSPIHIQYLKNMGVSASLVVSLMVAGKLWGLVSCHHYAPKIAPFQVRAVSELLAEAVATRISALENFAQAQSELSVRRLETRMMEAISRDGDWQTALFGTRQTILEPLQATGCVLLFEGQIHSTGEVPSSQQLLKISQWLESQPRIPVFATIALAQEDARFKDLPPFTTGLIATRVTAKPGEFLIWFRPEQKRTVIWGGDPNKPWVRGSDPRELSPRRSFAQWHEVVEGTCAPWTAGDLSAARLIGDTVSDVIFQFQSVRLLIARSQLDHVTEQVAGAEQPVLIADAHGKVLMGNAAFLALLPGMSACPSDLAGLAQLCQHEADVRHRLRDVIEAREPWRGEILLLGKANRPRPLAVRGDPVISASGTVLGFVLHFTDLTERKAVEAARQRFQAGIVSQHRHVASPLKSPLGLARRNLLSSVLENAQLAALEITDGLDVTRMPGMLESLRTSVERTADVLRQVTLLDDDTEDEA